MNIPKHEPFYRTCKDIIQNLMSTENSYFFFKPVDPEADGAPDYFSIVMKPMCFYKVQEKLDNNEYKTPNEFIEDVRLIWQNAKLYNHPSHLIYKTANILAHKFEILIGSLPQIVSEADKCSALQRLVELRFARYRINKKSHQ